VKSVHLNFHQTKCNLKIIHSDYFCPGLQFNVQKWSCVLFLYVYTVYILVYSVFSAFEVISEPSCTASSSLLLHFCLPAAWVDLNEVENITWSRPWRVCLRVDELWKWKWLLMGERLESLIFFFYYLMFSTRWRASWRTKAVSVSTRIPSCRLQIFSCTSEISIQTGCCVCWSENKHHYIRYLRCFFTLSAKSSWKRCWIYGFIPRWVNLTINPCPRLGLMFISRFCFL